MNTDSFINSLTHGLMFENNLTEEQALFLIINVKKYSDKLMDSYGDKCIENMPKIYKSIEKFIIRFVKKLNADIPCPPAEEY